MSVYLQMLFWPLKNSMCSSSPQYWRGEDTLSMCLRTIALAWTSNEIPSSQSEPYEVEQFCPTKKTFKRLRHVLLSHILPGMPAQFIFANSNTTNNKWPLTPKSMPPTDGDLQIVLLVNIASPLYHTSILYKALTGFRFGTDEPGCRLIILIIEGLQVAGCPINMWLSPGAVLWRYWAPYAPATPAALQPHQAYQTALGQAAADSMRMRTPLPPACRSPCRQHAHPPAASMQTLLPPACNPPCHQLPQLSHGEETRVRVAAAAITGVEPRRGGTGGRSKQLW